MFRNLHVCRTTQPLSDHTINRKLVLGYLIYIYIFVFLYKSLTLFEFKMSRISIVWKPGMQLYTDAMWKHIGNRHFNYFNKYDILKIKQFTVLSVRFFKCLMGR